jgi:Na+/proline symporter
VPILRLHYFPTGMLGLGPTALAANFMAGMAGNMTAFNTVCTHDIYEPYIRPNQTDQHYLQVRRFATVFGVVFSILGADLAARFKNIWAFVENGACGKWDRKARRLGLHRHTRSRGVTESCDTDMKNYNRLVS